MNTHQCQPIYFQLPKKQHAQITVAYRGIASYTMYRSIQEIEKLTENNICKQLFEVILNGLRSRIIIDTCKLSHHKEKIIVEFIKNNTELSKIVEENNYKSIHDYLRKVKNYRDKEITHCDYEDLYSDKYKFCLMSELDGNKNNAEVGKIYMNEKGDYLVLNNKKIIFEGCLPKDFGITPDTLISKLNNSDFNASVLDYTSETDRGHTDAKIKFTHLDISYMIFKIVFDKLIKQNIHCPRSDPSYFEYDFCLMSELQDNKNAKPGKIYLSEDGKYCKRDPNGIVRHAPLPIDLDITPTNLSEKLNIDSFKYQVLNITSKRGHSKPCKYIFNAPCSNIACIQNLINSSVLSWCQMNTITSSKRQR